MAGPGRFGHRMVGPRPSVELGVAISVPVSICGRRWRWHGVTVIRAGNYTSKAAGMIAPGTGNAILLTGATGFVGMAVLARLLEHTARDVVVLVRAGSQSDADARVNAVLGSVFGAPDRHWGRVKGVCGDLTAPGLGLGPDREWVAEEVGEVVHAAASVAFDLSLAESRLINVEGTRRVLDLAEDCAARGEGLRRITYVSTAYVAGIGMDARGRRSSTSGRGSATRMSSPSTRPSAWCGAAAIGCRSRSCVPVSSSASAGRGGQPRSTWSTVRCARSRAEHFP
jgi:hypothetical protein